MLTSNLCAMIEKPCKLELLTLVTKTSRVFAFVSESAVSTKIGSRTDLKERHLDHCSTTGNVSTLSVNHSNITFLKTTFVICDGSTRDSKKFPVTAQFGNNADVRSYSSVHDWDVTQTTDVYFAAV